MTKTKSKKLLTPGEYGAKLPEPRSASYILNLCRQRRVSGARLLRGRWMVPRNAQIIGRGRRLEYGANKGVAPREYAEINGVSRQRVYQYLNHPTGCKIEGAVRGPHGWDIPPDAPWPGDDAW